MEDSQTQPPVNKATRYEYAQTDIPHPFIERIVRIVFSLSDNEELTQEQIDTVKTTLTTFAHLVWPGDAQRHLFTGKPVAFMVADAIDYLCADIPKGSPITPKTLRQGVIPEVPRSG